MPKSSRCMKTGGLKTNLTPRPFYIIISMGIIIFGLFLLFINNHNLQNFFYEHILSTQNEQDIILT